MALNSIDFNRNKSGLGSPLLSNDHISGIVFYHATKPTGFDPNNIQKIFSLQQAEDLGIEKEGSYTTEWYHIREFFEKQPKGELYVGIFDVPGATPDFEEVKTMQYFATGAIRQIGVLLNDTGTDGTNMLTRVNALQSQITTLTGEDMPLNAIFAPDIYQIDLTTLPDLRTGGTANNVSVTIGQSGNGLGATLYTTNLKSTTDLGAKLGAVSRSKVHESIAYVEKFPMVTASSEFDEPAFSNGDFLKATPPAQITSLTNNGYIFMIKYVGYSGTLNSKSMTCVPSSNDLSTIERNRTIDKAVRRSRALLLPKLASPLYVNSDGTLTLDTIATFKGLTDQGLAQMESEGELSNAQTIIDSAQNVVSTNQLEITLELQPVGVAEKIIVNVGFVPTIAN
jgi:hypothetical protein